MSPNVGKFDRVNRIIAAILAAVFALLTSGTLSMVLWVVAAIMILTAAVKFCPVYKLFGFSTTRARH